MSTPHSRVRNKRLHDIFAKRKDCEIKRTQLNDSSAFYRYCNQPFPTAAHEIRSGFLGHQPSRTRGPTHCFALPWNRLTEMSVSTLYSNLFWDYVSFLDFASDKRSLFTGPQLWSMVYTGRLS